MIRREQQMIRTAILALLVVLALVYLLVYSIYYRPSSPQSSSFTGSDSPTTEISSHTQAIVTHRDELPTPTSDDDIPHVVISQDNQESPAQNPGSVSLGSNGITASEVATSTATTDKKILPGTRLITETTIADEIGVDYRYTLRDSEGIYYLNLGSSTQDLGALLQGQGGNTFALTTTSKILANQLFGSRVVFLNLPQYRDKTVLMVVTVGSERRLIQIPYNIYHESKPQLAQKFR